MAVSDSFTDVKSWKHFQTSHFLLIGAHSYQVMEVCCLCVFDWPASFEL